MVEKLKRRRQKPIMIRPNHTKATRHMRYITNKIKEFWRLRNEPSIQLINDTSSFAMRVDFRKCDFKVCNKYIFRIPTNKKDMYIRNP